MGGALPLRICSEWELGKLSCGLWAMRRASCDHQLAAYLPDHPSPCQEYEVRAVRQRLKGSGQRGEKTPAPKKKEGGVDWGGERGVPALWLLPDGDPWHSPV